MSKGKILGLLAAVLLAVPNSQSAAEDPNAARADMVRVIQFQIGLTATATGIHQLDPDVLLALGKVPRHAFVPPPLAPYAYLDRPLPLGMGQNISQPFIIALMTHLLNIEPGQVVLETGTGAGYHAAILAELGAKVFSVEVIEPLAAYAAERLAELGYDAVMTKPGDGYYGWREHGPYDAILLKEAVDHIPPPLLAQLKPGGRLVLPLGPLNGQQQLTVVDKGKNGTLRQSSIMPVRFAPLQGGDRI
ncbi:MAG: protein-L-isoaspartate(D-aspartate) O-methyltransferase [Alphaproteobacteria bacterium]